MSGRIRTIKPEWLDDEKLGAASDAARMLSIGLMLLADDHGRGRAHPLFIASRVWGYGDSHESLMKVSRGLAELEEIGFVILYTVAGQRYFAIRNWTKHQKVQHVGRPHVPGPEQADPSTECPTIPQMSHESHETLMRPSRDSHESLTTDPHTPDQRPTTNDQRPTRTGVRERESSSAVLEVFEHWRSTLGKGSTTKLDGKRRRRIEWALETYGLEATKLAIDGYAKSPWHRGQNPSGLPYDDLTLWLRSAEHVERGLSIARDGITPTKPSGWHSDRLPPAHANAPDDDECNRKSIENFPELFAGLEAANG